MNAILDDDDNDDDDDDDTPFVFVVFVQYRCELTDQAIGVCRGNSRNSSGAQQEAKQQQIKTVQWCSQKHGRWAVTSAGWCSVEP